MPSHAIGIVGSFVTLPFQPPLVALKPFYSIRVHAHTRARAPTRAHARKHARTGAPASTHACACARVRVLAYVHVVPPYVRACARMCPRVPTPHGAQGIFSYAVAGSEGSPKTHPEIKQSARAKSRVTPRGRSWERVKDDVLFSTGMLSRVRMRARTHVRVCACAHVGAYARAGVRVRTCVRASAPNKG